MNLCNRCNTFGRPRGNVCGDCLSLNANITNFTPPNITNFTPPNITNTPEPKEILECKECNLLIERINELSNLLHISQTERIQMAREYQSELDKMCEVNKNLIKLLEASEIAKQNESEEIKKKLKEKESKLENLENQNLENQKIENQKMEHQKIEVKPQKDAAKARLRSVSQKPIKK